MEKTRLRTKQVVVTIGIFALLCLPYIVPLVFQSNATFTSCASNLIFMSNGAGSWTNMTPAVSPSPRNHAPLVYDAESDRIILFGGWVEDPTTGLFYDDTWTYHYNTNTWTNVTPSTGPPGRGGHVLAYDNESDRVILFGGAKSGGASTLVTYQETWSYHSNTNTWANMSPSVMPSGRVEASFAYDIESDHIILFGGYQDGGVYSAETWVYNYNNNTWTNMNPTTHPSPRQSAPMTYDVESDRAIIMGGWHESTFLDETWAYDFNTNTWTLMSPVPHPQATSYGLSYDVQADRVISFGGSRNRPETQLTSDTWAYDFNLDVWTNMSVTLHPSARARTYMVYDIESDRTILFGGKGSSGFIAVYDDTWAYDYPAGISPPEPLPLLLIAGISVVLIIVVVAFVVYVKRRK